MGQAEGELRGDTDAVLTTAISKLSEEEFLEVLANAEAYGMLKASGYKNKTELINDLDNLPQDYKDAVAENLKNKRPAFE